MVENTVVHSAKVYPSENLNPTITPVQPSQLIPVYGVVRCLLPEEPPVPIVPRIVVMSVQRR
jgi:hypothetical protein